MILADLNGYKVSVSLPLTTHFAQGFMIRIHEESSRTVSRAEILKKRHIRNL